MEVAEGQTEAAREIFARGAQGSPHAPLLTAWADLEEASGRCALRIRSMHDLICRTCLKMSSSCSPTVQDL